MKEEGLKAHTEPNDKDEGGVVGGYIYLYIYIWIFRNMVNRFEMCTQRTDYITWTVLQFEVQ